MSTNKEIKFLHDVKKINEKFWAAVEREKKIRQYNVDKKIGKVNG